MRPIDVVPDWICEVTSPFELCGGLWMRRGSYDDRATARIKPFEENELEMRAVFPPR